MSTPTIWPARIAKTGKVVCGRPFPERGTCAGSLRGESGALVRCPTCNCWNRLPVEAREA